MNVIAEILDHRQVAEGIFLLEMSAPEIADKALPGQFVHIRCNDLLDPLLRRPFGVSIIHNNTISIVYEVRGRGTRFLSGLRVGDNLDVLGPLGNGFQISGLDSGNRAVLVGGGIGAAPLVALAKELENKGLEKVIVLLGAVSKDKLFPEKIFAAAGAEILVATDDGSYGHRGLVTELLPQAIDHQNDRTVVFACGPWGMMKAVAAYCSSKSVLCQLSMEAMMACGVGACQGCAIKVAGAGYSRVCKEGPVYDAREVVWDE